MTIGCDRTGGRQIVLAIFALAFAAATSAAAIKPERSNQLRAELEALRNDDLRVATIAYRLATANAPLCGRLQPQTGIVIHDAAQYGPDYRPTAIATFALGAGPSIEAIVPDSPAAGAGLLPDDALMSINGTPFSAVHPGRKASFDGIDAAKTLFDKAWANGPAEIVVKRDGVERTTVVKPALGCASLVQLTPSSGFESYADDIYITVSTALADYTQSDDELAVIVAHEMAHNILQHGRALDAQKVDRGLLRILPANANRIRETERAADYVGLYLMARASYDIGAGPRFWRRFGKDHGLGLLADGTHPSEKSRAETLEAEIDEIEAKRRAGAPLIPDGLPTR